MAYLYFTNTRLNAPEGGGVTWWAKYRLIHAMLYITAAIYIAQGNDTAGACCSRYYIRNCLENHTHINYLTNKLNTIVYLLYQPYLSIMLRFIYPVCTKNITIALFTFFALVNITSCYTIDHIHGSSPVFPVSRQFMQFNPHWYVVGEAKDFPINKPKKITLNGSPIAVWRDNSDNYAAISDICPHRGASLSHGRIDPQSKCIVCPYHTFKYNDKGRMVQTPGQKTMRSNDAFNFSNDAHYT